MCFEQQQQGHLLAFNAPLLSLLLLSFEKHVYISMQRASFFPNPPPPRPPKTQKRSRLQTNWCMVSLRGTYIKSGLSHFTHWLYSFLVVGFSAKVAAAVSRTKQTAGVSRYSTMSPNGRISAIHLQAIQSCVLCSIPPPSHIHVVFSSPKVLAGKL